MSTKEKIVFDVLVSDLCDEAERLRVYALKVRPEVSGLTHDRITEAYLALQHTAKMLNRVSWYTEGTDSEDTFNRKWDEQFKGV